MDTFALVSKIITELVPNNIIIAMATLIFVSASVSLMFLMFCIPMFVLSITDLIRLPFKQTETKGGRISLWQTVKGWFPKKEDKVQVEQ